MSVAARYEAAKSFDLEDDLEFCPVLTIDEVTPTICYFLQLQRCEPITMM
jgi:Domain of unknown function (DUF4452)